MVGKCLGGATVATLQGLLVLVLAPLVDVPYDPLMLLELILVMFLLAFALTAFGLVVAARIQNIQTVMGVMQVLLFPLAFLSGSIYPIGKPADLHVADRPRQPDHVRRASLAHHRVLAHRRDPGRARRAQRADHVGRLGGAGRALGLVAAGIGIALLGAAMLQVPRAE